VKLSARGQRDMDEGAAPITDRAELLQVRRQAAAVHMKALLAAAIVTAILVLL
jgi:hypothetical protein